MRILIVNDDGFLAAGIEALVKALIGEHELLVCAPKNNQSAVGHGITLHRTLHVEQVTLPGCTHVNAYCVDGTPADCTRVAVGNLGFEPELVISGINQAPNLGTDVLYSGTVAAAEEAAMLGYRSIAVSKDGFDTEYFDDVAKVFCEQLPLFFGLLNDEHRLLNVNFPNLPRAEYRGIRAGHLAEQCYPVKYDEVDAQDGRMELKIVSLKLTECYESDTTDEKLVRDGFISVTPLKYDITDYARLEMMKRVIEKDFRA
ncbi:MAG: 5'/3'-nucleotidase SurE [Christensenellaceae bacterium]|nr:5'/3'-nucleotidase SurE [Christensenellaceae bacterium]